MRTFKFRFHRIRDSNFLVLIVVSIVVLIGIYRIRRLPIVDISNVFTLNWVFRTSSPWIEYSRRNAACGLLTGLTRVRRFQQVTYEVRVGLDFINYVYDKFGFTFELKL
ncbi:uncharacterized protein [Spinacia oleracea]|uniref:Uncharacterized protein n=1 Tax=Spinacia oleracea TaxID=3562 RepID=A0A9R0IXS4_SPIOL|nr:uncharacterized protein LOC110795509 [Spinacia oleracea]